MSVNYQLLLAKAAQLYERYEAGRRDPFNVFSVLRTEHDEVNLHSRFLAALLDYRQSSGEPRENLKDFLCSVCSDDVRDFDPDDATVGREVDNVDILIRDRSSGQAVVIENKIWAGDQHKQLERYAKQQEADGYTPYLLYLTLDGHPPSEDSVGDLNLKCISLECISYEKHLLPWLKRCQQRAYDEPTLRESIAQYLNLIEKLTGTDYSEDYMRELEELCRQDNNLVLVHNLNEAMVRVKISLLQDLWQKIDGELKKIPDLPNKSEDSDISKERIENFVRQRGRSRIRICYSFGPCAKLVVEAEDSIFYGVLCSREENECEYNKFKKALEGGRSDSWYPWWCYLPKDLNLNLKHPDRKVLELMANEKLWQEYVSKVADEVASGVGEVWKKIKDAGLA